MAVRDLGRTSLPVGSCRALVAGNRRGRLVTTVGALPAAEPVPYVADGRQVVVRTVHPVRTGEVLSLLVDQVDDSTGAGWSVLVTGTARLLADDDRLVEHFAPGATDDWLYGPGQLVVLADPLIRGTSTSPAPSGWTPGRAGGTSAEALRVAVSLAVRAPSVHNTQPWRWRALRDGLDLYVEPGRRLPVLDPQGREQTISCGASLQHARLALVAGGWGVQTVRFPDPDDPGHLARLRLVGRVPPEERDVRLADAASHRRTDRRPFAPEPVPDDLVKEVVEAAEFEDCRLHVVPEGTGWQRVAELVTSAEHAQRADTAYRTELAAWTGAAAPAGTGVPPGVVPASVAGRPWMRDFGIGTPGTLPVDAGAEHPLLAVLATAGDGARDWLRAGEALGRVLLTATAAGLAVSPISTPVELPAVRDAVRGEVLACAGEPQLLLRLGLPAAGAPPPPTPREDG